MGERGVTVAAALKPLSCVLSLSTPGDPTPSMYHPASTAIHSYPQLSTAIHSYPQLSAVTWPSGLCLNYGRYAGYAGYAGYPSPPLVRGR